LRIIQKRPGNVKIELKTIEKPIRKAIVPEIYQAIY